jgi:CBS domain-containing protein
MLIIYIGVDSGTTRCAADRQSATRTAGQGEHTTSQVKRQVSGPRVGAEAVLSVAQAMVTNPEVSGPGLSRGDLDQLFADDHVHAALVVDDGRLITVIQRTDLEDSLPDADPCSLGMLTGRVVQPDAALAAVRDRMRQEQRRRLAVINESGRLLGLLCLKKSGTGFCSDADVRSRELERDRGRSGPVNGSRHVGAVTAAS